MIYYPLPAAAEATQRSTQRSPQNY